MAAASRSEEHTSELQSHVNLVCRLLLEKKKDEEYSEGCRRRGRGVYAAWFRVLQRDSSGQGCSGKWAFRRRGDQDAGERVSIREHRIGQRASGTARNAGRRFYRSNRCGGDEAFRIHGSLSWARGRRALYSEGSLLPGLQGEEGRLPSADGLGRGGAEQWNAQAYCREAAEDSPEAQEESAECEGCALGIGLQRGCQGYAEESECGPVEELPTIRGQGNCFRSVCGDDQSWQCSLRVCGINAGLGQGCGCSCDRDEPRRVSTGRSL